MQKELVTIGLPAYSASGLRKALDSLLSQTYSNFELVISDDASKDDTQRICMEYAKRDPRVKYIRQEVNLGQVGNFNFVWNQAKGDFFMMASDDDWWHPKFIETLKNTLDTHPDYGIAMCSFTRGLENGDKIPYQYKSELQKTNFYKSICPGEALHKFFYFGLIRTSLICTISKPIFPNSWLFDHVGQFKLLLLNRVYTISEVLWHKTSYAGGPRAAAQTSLTSRMFLGYVYNIFKCILSSNAPVHTKLIASGAWLALVWSIKRHLAREIFIS